MTRVNTRAFGGLLVLVLAMAAMLFIPAGTLDYWQAWTFLGVYSIASLAITLYLMKHDPKLLERRMRGGPTAEKKPAQRIIMLLASVGFIALLVVPALDHRLGWSRMLPAVALAGDGLLALGWLAIFTWVKWFALAGYFASIVPGTWRAGGGVLKVASVTGAAGALGTLAALPLRGVAAEVMLNGVSIATAALVVATYRSKV